MFNFLNVGSVPTFYLLNVWTVHMFNFVNVGPSLCLTFNLHLLITLRKFAFTEVTYVIILNNNLVRELPKKSVNNLDRFGHVHQNTSWR
jgi:hypothetical protein